MALKHSIYFVIKPTNLVIKKVLKKANDNNKSEEQKTKLKVFKKGNNFNTSRDLTMRPLQS